MVAPKVVLPPFFHDVSFHLCSLNTGVVRRDPPPLPKLAVMIFSKQMSEAEPSGQ
jgi:hypothetical protein